MRGSADGRWEEREKVIPLKKRKGSLEWGAGASTAAEKQKKLKTKTKRPTKKTVSAQDEEEEVLKRASEAGEAISGVVGKKGRRGNNNGLMEGSRCSRINGRGWRCCQQTLVGYSLCEHHLGKGRLRSMNSFPSRVAAVSRPEVRSKDDNMNAGSSDKTEAQTAASNSATKKKIGMVKARSISSLLGLSTAAIMSTDRSTTATTAAAASTAATTSS